MYVNGDTIEEISEDIGKSVNSIKKRIKYIFSHALFGGDQSAVVEDIRSIMQEMLDTQ